MKSDLIIILIGRVLQVFIMLISIRVLTKYLSVDEVGNFYVIMTMLTFVNLVMLNPPGVYFGRHLLHWQESSNLLNALFVFSIVISIVAIISLALSATAYTALDYINKFSLDMFLFFMFLAVIISTVHRNILSGLNTLGHRVLFVKFMLSTLVLGLCLSILLISYYENTALAWLMGIVLSELVLLVFIYKKFADNNSLDFGRIREKLCWDYFSKVFVFSAPIACATFLMWGQNYSYRLIVEYKYSLEILAYIGVGFTVASAVFSAIESIAQQYFNPIFLKKILNAEKKDRAEAWNYIANQVIPVYFFTMLFVVILSSVLVSLLVDIKFHDAFIFTMIGAVMEFFRVMTNLLNLVSQSELKTRSTVKPYLLGFTISIPTLLFVDLEGNYYFIALILSLSYFFVFLYMYRNMKKLLDISIDLSFIKLTIFALPFLLVNAVDIESTDFFANVFIMVIFGLYFLFILWWRSDFRINLRNT